MDSVKSTQNKQIKYVKALQNKARLRRGERKLVLEGDRLISDALQRGGNVDLALYAPEHADYQLIAALQNNDCALIPVSDEIMRYVSDTQQAPGIVAVFHIPVPKLPKRSERIIILDSIREPGNMGTILRSAAAAGVELVILSPNCVDPYNSKVMRAGMGAHFRLPIVEAPWSEIRAFCTELPVYATDANSSTPYSSVDFSGTWALLIGNEARGISKQARSMAQTVVSIPMSHSTESLNAAAAAAVILFEAQRQRSNRN